MESRPGGGERLAGRTRVDVVPKGEGNVGVRARGKRQRACIAPTVSSCCATLWFDVKGRRAAEQGARSLDGSAAAAKHAVGLGEVCERQPGRDHLVVGLDRACGEEAQRLPQSTLSRENISPAVAVQGRTAQARGRGRSVEGWGRRPDSAMAVRWAIVRAQAMWSWWYSVGPSPGSL